MGLRMMNVHAFLQKLMKWIYLIDIGELRDQNVTKINYGTNMKPHNYLRD